MDALADLVFSCNGLNEFFIEISGVWGSETQPFQTLDLHQFGKKIGKRRKIVRLIGCVLIQPERRHILSQQHDLFHTVGNQHFCFFHDPFRIAAAFVSADIRDDAIAAISVASAHNGNERVVGESFGAVHIDSLCICAGAFPQIQFVSAVQHTLNSLGDTVDLIGADHKIQMGDLFEQFIAAALCHTAHDPEDHVRLFLFQPFHDPQFADGFAFRLIADTAGIEDHQICIIFVIHRSVSL